jgi:hypothetical protein
MIFHLKNVSGASSHLRWLIQQLVVDTFHKQWAQGIRQTGLAEYRSMHIDMGKFEGTFTD